MLTVPHLWVKGDLTSAATLTPGLLSITDKHVAPNAAIVRSKLQKENYAKVDVDLTELRLTDISGLLPGTSSGSDLGLEDDAGFGSSLSPYVTTGDVKASTINRYAHGMVALPPEYVSAAPVRFELVCGFKTTIPDTTGDVDVLCHESDQEGGVGADLITTAATDFKSTTFATKSFNVTSTSLVAGDILYFRIHINVVDAATGTAVIGAIGAIALACQVQG